jgi:DNA-binding transcriptional regulator GbsR (MarR family)
MELQSAKEKFIQEWGVLCSNWGVNKTMGHIHALMLVSCRNLCADDIMAQLQISRGNANMNLRALVEWRLIEKRHIPGDRKDYYEAQKDLNEVFKIVIENRKKKEFDPLSKLVDDLKEVQPLCPDSNEFCTVINKIGIYTDKVDRAFNVISSSKMDWFSNIAFRD